MCCTWCDEMPGSVRVTLEAVWQRCFTCHEVTWCDPYTGCCQRCRGPVSTADNATAVCAKIADTVPVTP